ncbi:MAG TPA: endospore germination permease [Bacillus sp. (in: firmicutes)]|nr:endospore germination permease [Bacillus sp. (in: firmicutes)]
MNHLEGKIGIREYVSILIILVGLRLADDTPVLITTDAKNAGWIIPLISGVISIIPVFLLVQVFSVHREKNLFQILIHLFGKWLGTAVCFILFILGLIGFTSEASVYTDIIGTMYFSKTPTILIYSILMVVSVYGARKGLLHIGSVSWLVIFYVKIALFISLILSFTKGNYLYIFPIFGEGLGEIVKEGASKISIYIDFLLFIGFIVPLFQNFHQFKKGTKIALIIVSIELSVAVLSYIMLFDYVTVSKLNFPFHETIRYISFGFITNIETFFFPFWLIATFLKFSAYLHIVTLMFAQIFKIKRTERLIPLFAVAVLFLGMLPETPTFTIFSLRDQLFDFTSSLFFILPCVMWIFAKIKGDFKNETEINPY